MDELLSKRQINVGNHIFFPHIWPDIDVVENDGEVAEVLTTFGQPRLIEINGSLVVQARAYVSGPSTPEAGNDFFNDAVGIMPDISFTRETEVGAVFKRWRIARIREVNAIASVLQGIQKTIFKLPCNQLPNRIVFQSWRPQVFDSGNPGLGKYDDFDVHLMGDPEFRLRGPTKSRAAYVLC